MRDRDLPGTGLRLTELGFGASSLGNLYTAMSDDVARATVDAAWEAGIRYFDTAPHYGLGLSERRLGEALKCRPRDEYVLSTKVGRLLEPRQPPASRDDDIFEVPGSLTRRWDFTRDGVLRSIEASLGRLGLDRIDIAYVHDPDVSGIHGAANSALDALVELKREGVVSAIGVGSNNMTTVLEALARTDVDTVMIAGRVTLLEHDEVDHLMQLAGPRRIVAAAVFNAGLLARPRPDRSAHYDYRPASQFMLERANRLADVLEPFDVVLPQAALAFPLRFPGVASAVVGSRTSHEVATNSALLHRIIPAEAWRALAANGLIIPESTSDVW